MGNFVRVFLSLIPHLFIGRTPVEHAAMKDVSLDNPVLKIHLRSLIEDFAMHGVEDMIACERVRVVGLSRLKLSSYGNSFMLTLKLLDVPATVHSKIEICFHGNSSVGLCHCGKDEWKPAQNRQWSSVLSPYGDHYIDVKNVDGESGSVIISLKEEVQSWRFFFLGLGFTILLLAPLICCWVPFYYSSSMAVGVLLVVLILLFQGMKLLPSGRKSIFHFAVYGSMLSAGSLLVHYFSAAVNSILINFGLNEDMYRPVSIFVLVGIIFVGAATGYWIVRKFVLSEDGSVDVGIAQFVKWAMRILAMVFVYQSTLDTPLAIAAVSLCWGISYLMHRQFQQRKTMQEYHLINRKQLLWRAQQAYGNHNRVEFLGRSPKRHTGKINSGSKCTLFARSGPFMNEPVYSPGVKYTTTEDFYSVFHRTSRRRKFTRREWAEFTHNSTRAALVEWASSPEVVDWIVDNADRLMLHPSDGSDDGTKSESELSEASSEDGTCGKAF